VGLGALKPREGATVPGQAPPPPPDDKAPLKLAGPGEGLAYKKLAQEAADHQVCVDLFLLTQGHVDLASFVLLPRTTAGDVHHYQPFSFSLDTAQLYNDLHWTLVRPQGLEGVMRVRCSTGLSVASCSGAFCKQSTTDLDLPAVDCNKAFLCTLKHDDKLPPDGNEAAVQCALLYTTMTGERRIRVHTLSLPCTNIMGNLFRSVRENEECVCVCERGRA
jgi:protein transport protein SEC24